MCKHPSIVQFIDSYLLQGTLWVAMELINGEDLTQVINANKLTESQIALIIRDVFIFIILYFFWYIFSISSLLDLRWFGAFARERYCSQRYQIR